MKFILLSVFLATISIANTNVICKNKIKSSSIYDFSLNDNVSILAVQAEEDGSYVYGGLDPANSSISYYDDKSPICGGSASFNRIVVAYCDHNIDACWKIRKGVSGVSTIIEKDGLYTNNVIIVDSLPCLPYNVSNVTVSFYDYDHNDIGFANFLLSHIEEERKFLLSEE